MSINVSSSASSSSGGVGFLGLMTIVLMTLKLLGYISVSWWLVFLPVLIPIIILLGIGAVLLFAVFLDGRKKK